MFFSFAYADFQDHGAAQEAVNQLNGEDGLFLEFARERGGGGGRGGAGGGRGGGRDRSGPAGKHLPHAVVLVSLVNPTTKCT